MWCGGCALVGVVWWVLMGEGGESGESDVVVVAGREGVVGVAW